MDASVPVPTRWDDLPAMLTDDELRAVLRISRSTLNRHLPELRDQIKCVQVGDVRRWDKASARAFATGGEKK
jgi:hypothetical protein